MHPHLLWSYGHCHIILRGGDGSEETILCTICAYSWPGDDWNTILCGGKDVFAPHSAHNWAPFVFDLIFFLDLNIVFSLFKRKECKIKPALPRTSPHVLIAELNNVGA